MEELLPHWVVMTSRWWQRLPCIWAALVIPEEPSMEMRPEPLET